MMFYCDKHSKSSHSKEFTEIESYAIISKLKLSILYPPKDQEAPYYFLIALLLLRVELFVVVQKLIF